MDSILYFASALLGLLLSILIKPGTGISLVQGAEAGGIDVAETSIRESLVNFVPTNIFAAMSAGNMVPVIVFSIIFGIDLGQYTKSTDNRVVADFIKGVSGTITNIIKLVMKIAPIGIFALLANVAGTVGFAVILPMLKFLGLLAIGNLIQYLIYIPFTATVAGVNPLMMPKKFA